MNVSDEYAALRLRDCLSEMLDENASQSLDNVTGLDLLLSEPYSLSLENCNALTVDLVEETPSSFPVRVFSRPLLLFEAIALGFMILLTVLGNLLVIVAVVASPTLRSPTHSLIVNLAIADMLLGATVLPLSAVRELSGVWLLGSSLCSIWAALDVLCCTASILSLCGISVDRYIGVSRPLTYSRILTKRRAKGLIVAIWALALAISIAPPLGWKEEPRPGANVSSATECHVNKELGYVIFSACGSFYLPALVILVLYALVYRAAARHSKFLHSGSRVTRSDVTLRVHMGSNKSASNMTPSVYGRHSIERRANSCGGAVYESGGGSISSRNETWASTEQGRRLTAAGLYGRALKFRRQKKAAKTLGIVVGGFLLCWFPFFLLLPLDAACTTCDVSSLFNFAFWLGYFNSCINPFIYACSSRELRRAFRGILCWRRKTPCRQNNMTISLSSRSRDMNVSNSVQTNSRRHQ